MPQNPGTGEGGRIYQTEFNLAKVSVGSLRATGFFPPELIPTWHPSRLITLSPFTVVRLHHDVLDIVLRRRDPNLPGTLHPLTAAEAEALVLSQGNVESIGGRTVERSGVLVRALGGVAIWLNVYRAEAGTYNSGDAEQAHNLPGFGAFVVANVAKYAIEHGKLDDMKADYAKATGAFMDTLKQDLAARQASLAQTTILPPPAQTGVWDVVTRKLDLGQLLEHGQQPEEE